ncbi:ABC transporter substrate-binding protein [Desulfosediminicola flagellatus]|uniref:ABC transporter substrate-binding protein n=1 Tax=Desulfosediminicola flagellatus TaxID=2569541 RepID=UPI001593263D|nr:ABC transporter substrate-binding protein [Desulfosediminicola flagellatus]
MSLRFLRCICICIVAAFVSAPAGISFATAPPETLILAIKGEPEEGYDPILGWGLYGNPLFQSTLLKRDENMQIIPSLATRYTQSEDGSEWLVNIRKDAVFSDGTPLTAEDVAFTFRKAKSSGGKVDLAHLGKVEVTGKYSLTFHMNQRDTTFINRFITLGIVPQHAYGESYARKPIGSGPYQLTEWTEGQQMVAEVNPFYYGEPPFFKKIVFLFTDEDTSFAAARAGKVHMVVVPQSLAHQQLPDMVLRAVKSVDNRGLMFPTIPESDVKTTEEYPVGNSVTADPAIRKAVNLAINRQALVEGVLEGYGRPAYGVCDGLPWDNPENVISDNDIAGAINLLEQAGWHDSDGDGIREKDGLKAEFTIVYPASRSVRQYLALASADMLKKIGIRARVEGKNNFEEIRKVMHRDVIVFGWGSHDPIELYHLYNSKYAGIGYNNAGFYTNPVVDSNLERALAAGSFDESLPFWKAAQWNGTTGVNAHGDAAWAWLVNLDHTYFVHKNLDIGTSQVEPHGHGWPITANIEQWKWQ